MGRPTGEAISRSLRRSASLLSSMPAAVGRFSVMIVRVGPLSVATTLSDQELPYS